MNERIQERYIKINGKIITESNIKTMSLDELAELTISVNHEITSLSSAKKTALTRPVQNMDLINKLSFKLSKLSEGLIIISKIKKAKTTEIYKSHLFNQQFVDCAREVLNINTFNKIAKKAKDLVV